MKTVYLAVSLFLAINAQAKAGPGGQGGGSVLGPDYNTSEVDDKFEPIVFDASGEKELTGELARKAGDGHTIDINIECPAVECQKPKEKTDKEFLFKVSIDGRPTQNRLLSYEQILNKGIEITAHGGMGTPPGKGGTINVNLDKSAFQSPEILDYITANATGALGKLSAESDQGRVHINKWDGSSAFGTMGNSGPYYKGKQVLNYKALHLVLRGLAEAQMNDRFIGKKYYDADSTILLRKSAVPDSDVKTIIDRYLANAKKAPIHPQGEVQTDNSFTAADLVNQSKASMPENDIVSAPAGNASHSAYLDDETK